MILQALNAYYQRLLARGEKDLALFGYSVEKISCEIVLMPNGHVVTMNDIRDTSGKRPVPRLVNVPQPQKRTAGIRSNFLWDKTSYALGMSATSKRTGDEHAAFVALHRQALAGTDDAGLKALLAFLDWWAPDRFASPALAADMLDTNTVFRLDGEERFLHQRAAAQAIRARLLASDVDAAGAICLVTGESGPVTRLHPPVKGVTGAQSSGASIVSFNLESFTSYGKSQGDNAPVSKQVAFAYTTVLNHLLRRSAHNRQRLQVGDTSIVFWAEAADEDEADAAEEFVAETLLLNDAVTDAQETGALHNALEQLVAGKSLREIDPRLSESTRVYVLGLAPNAARISIRFWYVDTLGILAQNVAWHARDLRLEPPPWRTEPALWRLVLATAPSRNGKAKAEDVPPQLAGEMVRSVLDGRRYPGSLLVNVLMRMRTDGDLSGVRVALCKAVLARNHRLMNSFDDEEVPVSLDQSSLSPGYRLGRLFAVLESAQRGALGGQVNATIRDRYYGAASATPASVFPMLLRNAQNHLGKLRKEKPGFAMNLEKEIGEIIDGLPEHFPRSLRIEAQGQFAIGYYHQAQNRFHKKDDTQKFTVETEEATA